MSVVAIIPARAGSKGVAGKNTRLLKGRPLIAHTIDAALHSGCFAGIYVTSDDDRVLALAEKMGVTPIRRPAHLAHDTAEMADVVRHVAACGAVAIGGAAGAEAFVLLQPTSPLRTAAHIQACVELFRSRACASVVSVCALPHPAQKALLLEHGVLTPACGWENLGRNRQELAPSYRQNGAVWVVRWDAFLQRGNFVIPPAAAYEMSERDSLDIDCEADFAVAETALAVPA